MRFYFFELKKTAMKKIPCEIFSVITDFVFLVEGKREEGGKRRGEGRNRHTRDKIPCSSLADAVK